jgi:hypothetical protein
VLLFRFQPALCQVRGRTRRIRIPSGTRDTTRDGMLVGAVVRSRIFLVRMDIIPQHIVLGTHDGWPVHGFFHPSPLR